MYCYYIILPLPEVKSKITLYCSEIIFLLDIFLYSVYAMPLCFFVIMSFPILR